MFESLEDRRLLAAIEVTTALDVVDAGDGVISLREAIEQANTNGEADEITFAPALRSFGAATITLSGSELEITSDITITGPGSDLLTIDGNGTSRVLNVNSSAAVVIDSLTIAGGETVDNGGGILVTQSELTLRDTVVRDNMGRQGGGVAADSAILTIEGSAIRDNTSTNMAVNGGGGIYAQFSTSTIVDSSITGNDSASPGGGANFPSGSVRITNTTISENTSSSRGAAFALSVDVDATVSHSTITGNTGTHNAIDLAPSTLTATHVILADNIKTDTDPTLSADLGGPETDVSFAFSLIEDADRAIAGATVITDALLAPLAGNGGATLTRATLPGSPAIGAGDPDFDDSSLPSDQRRGPFRRVADGRIDIGAYERQTIDASALVVNTLSDEINSSSDDVSLREAIQFASGSIGGDTITFTNGLSGVIELQLGEMVIDDDLTIVGPGSQELAINGAFASRIFNIDDGDDAVQTSVEISGVTLSAGVALDHGGAIFTREDLTVRDSLLTGNVATESGGAIYSTGASLTIADSRLTSNRAIGDAGGAVRSVSGDELIIERSEITGNSSQASGGGVFTVFGTRSTITDSTISGNASGLFGGGFYSGAETRATFERSTVSGNSALFVGGIRFSGEGTSELLQSTVSGNTSREGAGGINVDRGTVLVRNSTIVGNIANSDRFGDELGADESGGGVLASDTANFVTHNSIFAGNEALLDAGESVPSDIAGMADPSSAGNLTSDPSSSGGLDETINVIGLGDGSGTVRPLAEIVNPALGFHGGPTQTHALAADSPAIDAGVEQPTYVLDDFSSDQFASAYNFFDFAGNPVNAPVVSDGQAQLNVGPGGAGFIWNQGHTLATVGDQVAVELDFDFPVALPGFFSVASAGIGLFGSVDGNLLGELRVETSQNAAQSFKISGDVAGTDLPDSSTGPFSLSVLVTEVTDTDMEVMVTLSGIGFDPIDTSRRVSASELFFGPVGFNLEDDDAIHDNLTFTPGIPPSDQRGLPFVREAENQIDIGAVEQQALDPALLVVTTTTDEFDFTNDDVSLREALSIADGIEGASTITFADDLTATDPATVSLSLGQLKIQSDITITGPGADRLTIDAGGDSRVFLVDDGNANNEADVAITGLTIMGGVSDTSGGGVSSRENLRIEDSILRGNQSFSSGGAVANFGTLLLDRTELSMNAAASSGGAVFSSDGVLSIRHSTINGNTAGTDGGGLYTVFSDPDAGTTISGSTFTGNVAGNSGGGIYSNGDLGGPLTQIVNSTISGNTAGVGQGGGVFNYEGLLTIEASTITGNTAAENQGAGVAGYADTLTRTVITGSIISGNTTDDIAATNLTSQNSFESGGFNLIGTGADFGTGNALDVFNETGDITGISDAMLGPLADNGGPTQTHALLAGSPAIDAGDPDFDLVTAAFDQRGAPFDRISGGRVDIGAFELAGANQIPSFTITDPATASEDANGQTVFHFASGFDPGLNEAGTSTATRVLHDEGEDGAADPLSIDNNNPTDVGPLAIGDNTLSGFLDTARSTGNVDVFTFTVPEGLQLSGLFVDAYAYLGDVPDNERNAFLAINDAGFFPYNVFELDFNTNPGLDTNLFLGGSVFGLDDLEDAGGGNILPRVGNVTGRRFTGPLGAGTYTVYIQQTGPANTYSLNFQVTAATQQTPVGYTISNLSDAALFEVAPTIDPTGTLRYTPAADAFGTATFEVTVQDSGGTDNGGTDTSLPVLATITLAPVNDAPTFVAADPTAILRDSGPQSDPDFITAFSPGPDNESDQAVLAYAVSNVSDPSLFAQGPAIDAEGALTYTPADGAIGSATFEVTVQDDGGTGNGGTDTSPPQTFTITINDLVDFGDAPAGYPVSEAEDGARHAIGDLRLGTDVDAEDNGVASADADSDGDDDDGVTLITSLVAVSGTATTSSFIVNASADGQLDAWIDFGANDDFADTGDQIATNVSLAAGDNLLSFPIPADAVFGDRAARFRFSSAGSLAPTGAAADGEVEDYLFTLLDADTTPDAFATLPSDTAAVLIEDSRIVVRSSMTDLLTSPIVDVFSAPATDIGALEVNGTDRDDVISIEFGGGSPIPAGGLRVDGATGLNTLRVNGENASLVFTDSTVDATNFSTIDLGVENANRVTLDAAIVRALAPTAGQVAIVGGQDDEILLDDSDDWRMGATSIVEGRFIRSVVNVAVDGGGESLSVELPNVWQNLIRASDVNNNGEVTAGDALVIINELARRAFSDADTNVLNDPLTVDEFPDFYFDQNNDGSVTALDALRVINELARTPSAPPEPEQVAQVLARDILFAIEDDDDEFLIEW